MNKAIIFLLTFFGTLQVIQSQVPTEQDCMGAIPVCQNVYQQQNSYSGTGNYPNEIPASGGCPGNCLLSGEKNDVWYIFTVQQSGNLSFLITPNNSADDYDWAVYNLTNASCPDIYNNINSLQVSCNYSADPGSTGPNGQTNQNCGDASSDRYNAVIPVQAGQTYVINVSNFSSTQYGYTLDFSASTAVIFDNVPPYIHSLATTPGCGATTITFHFSENVLCNTVSTADFAINGPGGPYTVTNVTGQACSVGGNQEKTYTITVSPAITQSGNYQICLNPASVAGSVTDLCGNVAPPGCLDFSVTAITLNLTSTPSNCNAPDGTATVTATGGSGNYTYLWSTNPPQTTPTATGLIGGTYSVTVSDGSCQATGSVVVNSIGGPTLSITGTDDACGQGIGTATVTATGGAGSYSYLWNTNPPQTTPTATGLTAGTYSVTVSDGGPCPSSISITINDIPGPTVTLVNMTPETAGQNNGSATVQASGGTPPYTYTWNTNPPQNTATASNLSAGTYTVTVTDHNGCTATFQVTVTSTGGSISLQASPDHCNLCDGKASVTVINPVGNYIIQWSNGRNTPVIDSLCSGIYTVTVTDEENQYVQSIYVPLDPGPTAQFTVSPNPATAGETVVNFYNNSTHASSYLWIFGDGFTSNATNPTHVYNSSGTFQVWLYAFNSFGCKDSMSMNVIVDELFTIYIPNSFSPNGDNLNDLFVTFGQGISPDDFSLRIYDRWGKIVFHSNSLNTPWDGSIDGVFYQKGTVNTYTYYLQFRDRTGRKYERNGTITVIY